MILKMSRQNASALRNFILIAMENDHFIIHFLYNTFSLKVNCHMYTLKYPPQTLLPWVYQCTLFRIWRFATRDERWDFQTWDGDTSQTGSTKMASWYFAHSSSFHLRRLDIHSDIDCKIVMLFGMQCLGNCFIISDCFFANSFRYSLNHSHGILTMNKPASRYQNCWYHDIDVWVSNISRTRSNVKIIARTAKISLLYSRVIWIRYQVLYVSLSSPCTRLKIPETTSKTSWILSPSTALFLNSFNVFKSFSDSSILA